MVMVTDLAPIAGTVGEGFFSALAGHAIKVKVEKVAAAIVGLYIAALAYQQYQRFCTCVDARFKRFRNMDQSWVDFSDLKINQFSGD